MVKRCSWGTCNSDTRYPERLVGDVKFIPFPKPKTNIDKCKRWIKLCGRPSDQLNTEILRNREKAKHYYVCTKHFINGKPTAQYPDPISALPHDHQKTTPARPPPKQRICLGPEPSKKRKILEETQRVHENADHMYVSVNMKEKENEVNENGDHTYAIIKEMQDQSELLLQEENLSALNPSNNSEDSDNINPLDILAVIAENKKLKEDIAKLVIENENLMRDNSKLENTCTDSKQDMKPVTEAPFRCDTLKKNPKNDEFKYYTGFSYEKFMAIFQFLAPEKEPFTYSRKVSSIKDMGLNDQLLLVLIKLRQNYDFKHLSKLFGISSQDCSTVFRNWINFMFYRFASVPIWPHRDVLQQNMPQTYKHDFPNTFVIIDGTEVRIQRPSSLVRQSQCYSDYKSSTTLKGLIGVDPRGSVIFISMLFSGSISDKDLTEKCGFYDLLKQMLQSGKLKEGDGIMADKGFTIQCELNKLGLQLNIPPFAPSEGQLSGSDVALTEKIAKHRVHVERAISRIKKFKILSEKICLSLFSCINQIWFVCCFLTNFMPYLIQDRD